MYGKIIQKMRTSKNITLKEAAGEALSVSQLSRFENNKTMIPVGNFFDVLENLNVTIEEFEYVHQEKETNQAEEILFQIEEYNNKKDLEELRNLITEIKQKNPAPYSWEQFLIYFIECILAIYDEEETQAYQPVLDYLMQVENWGEMELKLYALFGFAFDIETTHFLMRTALKRSQQYLQIPSTSGLLYAILSNSFSTFLTYDRLDYAEETIQLFDEYYAENALLLSPHIDFMFNKGLLAFRKNDLKTAKKYCENAIEICKYFKQKESFDYYSKRYKQWLKNYENPDYRELSIKVGMFDTNNN
jgi:Rgg/GadR/MutR family transcriptional activator